MFITIKRFPEARYGSIRKLLSLGAEDNWEVEQLDVKEEIYMDVQYGYSALNGKVCLYMGLGNYLEVVQEA